MSDTFMIQGFDTKPLSSYKKYTNDLCGELTHYMHYEATRIAIQRMTKGEQKCIIRIGNEEVLISNHDLYEAWYWAEYGEEK